MKGQNLLLLVSVHTAEITGADKLMGSLRIPLRAHTKVQQQWYKLSATGGGDIELSIAYVSDAPKSSDQAVDMAADAEAELGREASAGTTALDSDAVPEVSDLSEDSVSPEKQDTFYGAKLLGMSLLNGSHSHRGRKPAANDVNVEGIEVQVSASPDPSPPNEFTVKSGSTMKQECEQQMSSLQTVTEEKMFSAAQLKHLFESGAAVSSHAKDSRQSNDFEEAAASRSPTLVGTSDEGARGGQPTKYLMNTTSIACANQPPLATKSAHPKTKDDPAPIARPEIAQRKWNTREENMMRAEVRGISPLHHPIAFQREIARGTLAPITRRSWYEKKSVHASRSAYPEQQVIDVLLSKMQATELELMVTKEELSVERGKRIQAEERSAWRLKEIDTLTVSLTEQQASILTLQERLRDHQHPASSEVIIQEQRQLHLSRALCEFVLDNLQNKLRSLCSDATHGSHETDTHSVGSQSVSHASSAAKLKKLREECVEDLKSMCGVMDGIRAVLATRDNAARYAMDRARHGLVQSRQALSALQNALSGTERELEGIRQGLEVLHEQEPTNSTFGGVSFVQRSDVTSYFVEGGHGLGSGVPLEQSWVEVEKMYTHLSSALGSMQKMEQEFKVMSKLFEQKDRTCNSVLASFIHSKHAGEAGWSIHASTPWGGGATPAAHSKIDLDFSVKDHRTLIEELDAALFAELCSSRRLQAHSVPRIPKLHTLLDIKKEDTTSDVTSRPLLPPTTVDDGPPFVSLSHSASNAQVLLNTGAHVPVHKWDHGARAHEALAEGKRSSTSTKSYCPALDPLQVLATCMHESGLICKYTCVWCINACV